MSTPVDCPYCAGTLFDHADDCTAGEHFSVGQDGTMYKDGVTFAQLIKPTPEVIAWGKAQIANWGQEKGGAMEK